MRPYTDTDIKPLFSAQLVDNATSTALTPAAGDSLEANAYEDFVVCTGLKSTVDGAKSASVQFWEKNTQDGTVQVNDWFAVGSPIVLAMASDTSDLDQNGRAVKNRLAFSRKYVSAVVTWTHPDPSTTGNLWACLLGVGKNKVS